MYKVDRQGKIKVFEERFERKFVKKEEKDIGYEDKRKTTEFSLLYYISHFFSFVWNIFGEEDV